MSRHYQGPDPFDDGRLTPAEIAARREREDRLQLSCLATILAVVGFVVLLFGGVAVYVTLERLSS